MPIEFTCECGKTYRVKDELAGRRVKCSVCGKHAVIPHEEPPELIEFPEVIEPATGAFPEEHGGGQFAQDSDLSDPRMQRDLESINRISLATASNPAMLRVNYLRYLRNFPRLPFGFFAALVVSVLLTVFVHWGFAVLAAAIAWCNVRFWGGVRFQFIAGCVNPGAVVCLDPPLLAVTTNLYKEGDGDCPVVKVLAHPISRMVDTAPAIGQRVATAARYYDGWGKGPHWSDFDPIAVNCVSGNLARIERIFRSIDADAWRELELGLKQIPQSPEPGLYRIFPTETKPLSPDWLRQNLPDLVASVLGHLPKKACYLAREGIPAEKLQEAHNSYAPGVPASEIVALVDFTGVFKGRGLLITFDGVFYSTRKAGKGSFRWADLRGAFHRTGELQVVFRDFRRIRFSTWSVGIDCWNLERLFNIIAGVSEE